MSCGKFDPRFPAAPDQDALDLVVGQKGQGEWQDVPLNRWMAAEEFLEAVRHAHDQEAQRDGTVRNLFDGVGQARPGIVVRHAVEFIDDADEMPARKLPWQGHDVARKDPLCGKGCLAPPQARTLPDRRGQEGLWQILGEPAHDLVEVGFNGAGVAGDHEPGRTRRVGDEVDDRGFAPAPFAIEHDVGALEPQCAEDAGQLSLPACQPTGAPLGRVGVNTSPSAECGFSPQASGAGSGAAGAGSEGRCAPVRSLSSSRLRTLPLRPEKRNLIFLVTLF